MDQYKCYVRRVFETHNIDVVKQNFPDDRQQEIQSSES